MEKLVAEDLKLKINNEPTWYKINGERRHTLTPDALSTLSVERSICFILGSSDIVVCSETEFYKVVMMLPCH